MKRVLIFLTFILSMMSMNLAAAQENEPANIQDKVKIKIYCDVICVQYNFFKRDVNALIDFGLAEKAKDAYGWIYNTEDNKKMSFASPMSVFKYMSNRGWEYKDTIITTDADDNSTWHFILTKEMPADSTPEEIVGNIDCRNN